MGIVEVGSSDRFWVGTLSASISLIRSVIAVKECSIVISSGCTAFNFDGEIGGEWLTYSSIVAAEVVSDINLLVSLDISTGSYAIG